MAYHVTMIAGDGIGPEVATATQRVVEATGVSILWKQAVVGLNGIEKHGKPLPDETLEMIKASDATIKGPVATALGKGFRSVNVELRKTLQVYANFRPAKSMTGIKSRYSDVDLIVIRENTEGLYSGLEHTVVPGVVESLRVISSVASERIATFAFETARKYDRKRVTCIHKANILKLSDGLFLDSFNKIAANYPDIESDDCIVDAAAMKLVLDPHSFDVMVMENLFGDILSDLTSGLVGGLGVTPSANIGEENAIFEAVHGTAPDIAGKGLANPTALILSAALMLRYLGEAKAGDQIQNGVEKVIAQGKVVTGDIGGNATTNEYVAEVIANL